MKNLILFCVCLCFYSLSLNAQSPETINYQAVARDTNSNPIANTALTLRISLLDGSSSGSILYQETFAVITNKLGQYSVKVGNGNNTGAGSVSTFSAIDWSNTSVYLRSEINPGSGFQLMGAEAMSSVPYALHAKSTDALPDGNAVGQILTWNGTAWIAADVCGLLNQYFRDADGDSYGDPNTTARACYVPFGYVLNNTDCNDQSPVSFPGGSELCNVLDDDCDGLTDEDFNLNTDLQNCGQCGIACPSRPNAVTSCVGGICQFTCLPGFGDCNNNMIDGCEVDLLTSPFACGNCNNNCVLPNANSICINGLCAIGSCNPGFANCNGNVADGCEVNIASDLLNCGACNSVCPNRPNTIKTCVNGVCSYICTTNFADCNNNMSDGCETNLLTSANNCSGCGNVCTVPNANSNCVGGLCTIVSCATFFANCNGLTADGCEVHLLTNINNCGSCGNACPPTPNTFTNCLNGVCFYQCLPGFADCNSSMSNGCEVNILTNVNNCNGCNVVCPSRANTTKTCVNGVCTYTCITGFANCDGNMVNGCEVNILSNDPANCGACGSICPPGKTCVNGVCN